MGGECRQTRRWGASSVAPKVPEAVQKWVNSGRPPDPLFELLILGPWVRVPPGTLYRSTPFGHFRARRGDSTDGAGRCASYRTRRRPGPTRRTCDLLLQWLAV